MPSLLDQLDRRESVLLMYLAGELSARERAEVDRRLAADAGLAADLDGLRAIQSDVMGHLDRLDAADPLPVDPSVAVKRVGDMLRQHMAVPAARRLRPAASKARAPYDVSRRLVGWAAVAAAVAVVASVGPQLAQLWRSAPAGRPGGNPGQVAVAPDRGLEIEINQLAFDKWAHPDEDMIDAWPTKPRKRRTYRGPRRKTPAPAARWWSPAGRGWATDRSSTSLSSWTSRNRPSREPAERRKKYSESAVCAGTTRSDNVRAVVRAASPG